MNLSWELNIQHIPRDHNQLADSLAKDGLTTKIDLYSCPSHLRTLVTEECEI